MKASFELFGVVGYCRPLDFLAWWGIVDPIGFLVEGGILSLECPRETAVFGQTIMPVVRGGVLLNDQWSFLSDLSMMWGGFANPAPDETPCLWRG